MIVCRLGHLGFAISVIISLVGCDSQLDQFGSNQVFSLTLAKSESVDMSDAEADASIILENLFGTPDSPTWPSEAATEANLVQVDRLRRAAGKVSSEQDGTHLGLFREHCVVCHGVSGSGSGPASQFQNPYPRDFRPGIFKWKTTERSSKPSREDLKKLLLNGVPGTGMPSFSLLDDSDLEALVDYVIYLSIRGEVERRLLSVMVTSLGYGDDALLDEERLTYPKTGTTDPEVLAIVKRVVTQWVKASRVESLTESDYSSRSDEFAISRGRDLFHGKIANCVGCHGMDGEGGLETRDFDDWTKEYTTKLGLSPEDKEALEPFRKAGAHRPREIQPRILKGAVFRGGDEPGRLFQLINHGIAGTPMPGVALVSEESGKGLTESQIWDLVSYLRSLQSQ